MLRSSRRSSRAARVADVGQDHRPTIPASSRRQSCRARITQHTTLTSKGSLFLLGMSPLPEIVKFRPTSAPQFATPRRVRARRRAQYRVMTGSRVGNRRRRRPVSAIRIKQRGADRARVRACPVRLPTLAFPFPPVRSPRLFRLAGRCRLVTATANCLPPRLAS